MMKHLGTLAGRRKVRASAGVCVHLVRVLRFVCDSLPLAHILYSDMDETSTTRTT